MTCTVSRDSVGNMQECSFNSCSVLMYYLKLEELEPTVSVGCLLILPCVHFMTSQTRAALFVILTKMTNNLVKGLKKKKSKKNFM